MVRTVVFNSSPWIFLITMNEDALPADLPKDFDLEQYIIPTRLTDATENGGLFGIRFG
ncbi:MAG: hypothetical protein JRG74_03830 [Deltaproteobacteria bacterium]|nr:hypothetical protein [Deltaproteobacteria bacterium]